MHQIKIFKQLENDLPRLETQVNTWLKETNARIVSMSGNIAPQSTAANAPAGGLSGSAFAPSDVLLVILYEQS